MPARRAPRGARPHPDRPTAYGPYRWWERAGDGAHRGRAPRDRSPRRRGDSTVGANRARAPREDPSPSARPRDPRSEPLQRLLVDVACRGVDQVVLGHVTTCLPDLHVGQVREVVRVHRPALEMGGARHDDAAHHPEVLALLQQRHVEHDTAGRALDEPEADGHHPLVLHRLVVGAERDGNGRQAAHVAVEDEVAVLLDHRQRAMPADLVLDRPSQAHTEAVLAGVILEVHAHRTRAGRSVRLGSSDPVAAGGEDEEGERGDPGHMQASHTWRLICTPPTPGGSYPCPPQLEAHTTRFTIRPGTTICLRTGRPPRWAQTCGSASAAATSSASPASAATTIRPRSFPFTCTGTSMTSRRSAAGSALGQPSASRGVWWPETSQSSFATWGTNGASSRSVVSIASRSTAGCACSAASAVARTSSMTAAIAVLKWSRSTTSSVTRAIVRWVSRWSAWSAAVPSETAAAGGARRGATVCTRRHRRPRKRLMPSTPSSLHSRSRSGGEAKRQKSRTVSAPWRSTSWSGSTTLPFDLLIFAPSLMTIPCVRRSRNGSSSGRKPRSRSAFVKKRA